MDLLPRVRCCVCEKIFCCPEHRRKHEKTVHSLTRKHEFRVRSQAESYALEIRKSFFFFETKDQSRPNILSRKRKHGNFSLRVSQITTSTIEMGRRKIVTPKRNANFRKIRDTDMPKKAKGNQQVEKSVDSDDLEEEQRTSAPHDSPQENFSNDAPILPDELISPVEPEGRASKKSLASGSSGQNEDDGPNENKVFTSTPIQKKARIATNDLSHKTSALPSSSKTESGWLSRQRKVHFSNSGDSLYMTANEENSTRRGIFTTVSSAIQSALKSLPGSSKIPEQKELEVMEEGVSCDPSIRFPPIRGRRALRPSIKDIDSS